jgi:GntR family transcriptional regulator
MPLASNGTARPTVARPLYSQVRELMLERIERGDWKAGDALPNEFQLSHEFGVSIGTIRRAVEGLEDAGLVVRKQGRGTFLSGQRRAVDARRLHRLLGQDGRPLAPSEHLDGVARRAANPIEALSLRTATNAHVLQIDHLVRSQGRLVGLERTILDADRWAGLETRLTPAGHVYDILAEGGRAISAFSDTVAVERADMDVAQRLQISAGAVLLSIRRVLASADGAPAALRRGWYRPDRVTYAAAFDCTAPSLFD